MANQEMEIKMVNYELDEHIRNLISQGKIQSGSYCIAKNGEVVSCNAIGNMDLGNGNYKQVRLDSIFETQSITKLITAVAILILQERGQLSLHDRVGSYIKEFNREPFAEITIMHLLTHTSGLVAIEGSLAGEDLEWQSHVDKNDVANSWIPAVLEKGLSDKPGSSWKYSMAGFCLLGEVIARVTGERAEDFIRREILNPCEMSETHWKREITDEWAKRYQVRTEKHRKQYARAQVEGKSAWIDYCTIWDEIPETAGGLMSTVQDLIQFGIMLAAGGVYKGKRILQEDSFRFLEENQLKEGTRDYCWDHGGSRIAYGAGCPVYNPEFERDMKVSERTFYHEGTGTCVLMVNRKDALAAVWNVPFRKEDEWYAEAVKDTASIIWKNNISKT